MRKNLNWLNSTRGMKLKTEYFWLRITLCGNDCEVAVLPSHTVREVGGFFLQHHSSMPHHLDTSRLVVK